MYECEWKGLVEFFWSARGARTHATKRDLYATKRDLYRRQRDLAIMGEKEFGEKKKRDRRERDLAVMGERELREKEKKSYEKRGKKNLREEGGKEIGVNEI